MPEQRVAIVTGAGSGIGRATAIQLAHDGYSLVLAGRRRELLEETAEACDAAEVLVLPADLSEQGQAEGVVDAAAEAFGRVDALINNAGHGQVVPLAEMSAGQFHQTMLINAYAPAWLTMRTWPIFVAQQQGCVVNVGSMAVYDPYPGFFAYGASKGALSLMTLSVAKEGAASNIRAFCVAPGATETPMLRRSFDTGAIPADASLDPAAVAAVIAGCLAGDLDSHNGQTIPVLSVPATAWFEEFARAKPSAWLDMHGR